MEFAANISAKVQAWFDDVTLQLYPLPKMGVALLNLSENFVVSF